MNNRNLVVHVALLTCLLAPARGFSQTTRETVDQEVIAKIKEEGLQRSQIMETISFLTDVHGPRLTGSPLTRRAGEWTQGKLTEWGLQNARLESWGPFGRGWSLDGFSAKLLEPSFAPLIAYPKAWSPSTPKAVRGEPIYLNVETEADLEKYRGKLHRAIVLISPPRAVKALFEAPAQRQTDEALLKLANAETPAGRSGNRGGRNGRSGSAGQGGAASQGGTAANPAPNTNPSATSEPAKQPPANPAPPANAGPAPNPAAPIPPAKPEADARAAQQLQNDKWQLAFDEGAAVIIEPGTGDGGTVFLAAARLPRRPDAPGEDRRGDNPNGPSNRGGPRPWAVDAPEIVPQVVMAVEHYNRLIRMIQKGLHPQVEIDIASRYHNEDLNSFNILAEIPGTDLKDEIVMLGAHFDSWHSGTGATDNAVGSGVALEAVRILKAIGIQPRRTIRIGLWTGEEQGLLGSKAYVTEQFGRAVTPEREAASNHGEPKDNPANKDNPAKKDSPANKDSTINPDAQSNKDAQQPERPRTRYELKPAQQQVSAYFNLDNGTGKIRGIYMQGNEQVRPIFRAWLQPFADMGASTITPSNTGGTDHLSFDSVGIPGFQFIQDPLEYNTRTHHSNMDVYERVQEEDAKQAAIIMASFAYHAAMRDEKLPRKPLEGEIAPASTNPASPAAAP